MVDFGERLKSLRLAKNLKQSELGELLGLTKSVVSAYETGLRMPSYEVLIKMAHVFNVSTDYLLGVDTKTSELDLSGLTQSEKDAITNLIAAMKKTQ